MLRIVVGIALLTLVFMPRTAYGWFGLVPLVTGVVGYCPLYAALGLDTRRQRGAS